jgi:threonine synthase
VKAWSEGAETTSIWQNAVTNAPGLRVPGPFAGRQMLKILRDTGGHGRAVREADIVDAQRRLARIEGIWTAPEAAATVAALIRMKDEGVVAADTRVMLVFTGCGIKNPPPPLPTPVDLAGDDAEVFARVKQAIGI